MKVFVTGSTGLLGSNLVKLLVEQGHQVKALVRSKEKAEKMFPKLNIEFIKGDIADIPSFSKEFEGCDILFHTAAYFREYYQPGDHWKTLEEINVIGTEKILLEAEKKGIKKVIYTSSVGVIDHDGSINSGDEKSPTNKQSETNLYFKSKVMAERVVEKFLKEHSMPVVSILPGWMFGPGDLAPTSSGQLIIDYLGKKIPGIIDGGTCTVDARDVAQVMINAVESGKSGERYIVAGNYLTMQEIFKTLEKVTTVIGPKLKIPTALLMIVAWGYEIYGRYSGKSILITRDAVKTITAKQKVSSDKAKKELNAKFRTFEETITDEIKWYKKNTKLLAV